MGAQHGPIDGPWQKGRRTIDGNAMVHRWPMDGLPWDPNSGTLLKENQVWKRPGEN